MRLLLDTHIALWALVDDKRLTARARKLVDDPGNAVFVSVASIWEIAIKRALHRTAMPFSGTDAIEYCTQAGYLLLDVCPAHAAAVESLPPLHADPFDRMLVAQAMLEPMRLITHDHAIAPYSESVILV